MITLLFLISMLMIFGRIAGVAVRMSWGLIKITLSLILLPGLLIAAFLGGLIYIACPILIGVGIISLLSPKSVM